MDKEIHHYITGKSAITLKNDLRFCIDRKKFEKDLQKCANPLDYVRMKTKKLQRSNDMRTPQNK